MASGRRLNKTSDDPLGAARSQDIVTTISSQQQLLQNIEENIAWLQRTENEINSVNELLGQIRTLAISQSGSDSNEESRLMVAREFSAARKNLFDIGNSREGKLYLFSGIKSLTPALKKNGIFQPAKVEKKGISQRLHLPHLHQTSPSKDSRVLFQDKDFVSDFFKYVSPLMENFISQLFQNVATLHLNIG